MGRCVLRNLWLMASLLLRKREVLCSEEASQVDLLPHRIVEEVLVVVERHCHVRQRGNVPCRKTISVHERSENCCVSRHLWVEVNVRRSNFLISLRCSFRLPSDSSLSLSLLCPYRRVYHASADLYSHLRCGFDWKEVSNKHQSSKLRFLVL